MGLAGSHEGGLFGAIASRGLMSTADALRKITDGVLDGHLVFVGLDPRMLRTQQHDSAWSPLAAHTVRVTAIEGSESGTHFWIYDTGGPQRSYRVHLTTLFSAYDSARVVGSRGVFITEERVFASVQRPRASI